MHTTLGIRTQWLTLWVTVAALNAMDLATTLVGIEHNAIAEDNPLMVFIVSQPALAVTVKAAILTFLFWTLRLATVNVAAVRVHVVNTALAAVTLWYAYVVYNNAQILKAAGLF